MTKIKNYEQDSTINDEDKVIGTDGVSGVNLGRTKNYTIASLVNYINTQLDPISGGGTTNTIPIWVDDEELGDSSISQVEQEVYINNNLHVTAALADSDGSYGTAGQVLATTVDGVEWVDNFPDNVSGTLNNIAMFTPDGNSVGDSPMSLYSGRILVAQGTDFEAYNAAFKNVEILDDVVIGEDNQDTLTVNSISNFNELVTVNDLSRLHSVRIINTLADSDDEVGTSGQILSSTGTGVQWIDNDPDNVSGTLNTIAMFTPDGDSVGDSPITFNDVDTIDVTGNFRVSGDTAIGSDSTDALTVNANSTFNSDIIIGQDSLDTLTVNSSSTFNNNITIDAALIDGNTSGTSGQVLSSTGTGVEWVDKGVSGTLNTIAMFTPDGDSVGDSPITFNDVDTIDVTGNFRVSGDTAIGSDSTDALTVNANSTFNSDIIIGQDSLDTLTVNSSSTFNNNITIDAALIDGNTSGTSGQVLSSTGTGVEWVDNVASIIAGTDISISSSNGDVTINATGGAANTTYNLSSSSLLDNVYVNLTGSDSVETSVRFTASGSTSVSNDTNTININSIVYSLDAVDGENYVDISLTGGVDSDIRFQGIDGVTIDYASDVITLGSTTYSMSNTQGVGEFSISLDGSDETNNGYSFTAGDNVVFTHDTDTTSISSVDTKYVLSTSNLLGNVSIDITDSDEVVQSITILSSDNITTSLDDTSISISLNDNINVSGDVIFGTDSSNTAEFLSTVEISSLKDSEGSLGTSGQFLVSNGSDIAWKALTDFLPESTVFGTGTTDTLPLWTPDGQTLGDSLISQSNSGLSLGVNASNTGLESIAFTRSSARADYSFALAYEGITDGEFSVALGKGTYTAGDHSMATNYKSIALGKCSFAAGHSSAAGGDGAFAAGHNASAGNYGVATADDTTPNDVTSVDISNIVGTVAAGTYVRYAVDEDVADPRILVTNFLPTGPNSGTITLASGIRSIAGEIIVFEQETPIRGDHQGGIALGNDAFSLGEGTIAIGHNAQATADKSVAIGYNAVATGIDTMALGGDRTKIIMMSVFTSDSYTDDSAAAASGVELGQLYRTGNIIKIRMT